MKEKKNNNFIKLIYFKYGGLLSIGDSNTNIYFEKIESWHFHSSVVIIFLLLIFNKYLLKKKKNIN